MDVREKLVELQLQADIADNVSENTTQHREFTADFMMANGVTVQEWISVKDGVPDTEDVFLCWSKDLADMMFCYTSDFKQMEVTHWMPLPEAPREDEDEP